jgi:acetyl esterase/lipase
MEIHSLRRRLITLAAERHRAAGDALTTNWPLARREYEREMAKAVPVDAVTRSELYSGVRCDVIDPPGTRAKRVVLFLHGGGYTMGSPATHHGLAARVGVASDATVVLPEYRLAPEHPFPAGLDDARKVWGHLVEVEAIPASSIALVGDSAGGGLAAALTLALMRESRQPPSALILMSPWTDLTLSSPTIQVPSEVDPLVDAGFLSDAREAYVAEHDLDDPLVSPAYGDWCGAPPTLIQVGRSERLLDDARVLYRRMVSDGVRVRLEEWDDLVHVWHQFAPALPQATDAIERIGAYVRRYALELGASS